MRTFILVIFSVITGMNAMGQWSYVGNNISTNNTYPGNYSFAKDKRDTLYVAFADNGNQYIVTVKKLVSGIWTNVGTPGFVTGVGNSGLFYKPGTSIAINPVDNRPYIALSDGDHDNKVSVLKYNDTGWMYVGAAGFSATSACSAKLAFTQAGIPYVSYADCYNSSGINVMRLNGSLWELVGAADFANGNYVHLNIAANSTISVAFQDQSVSNKVSVMRFNGGAWAYVGTAGFSDDVAENISIAADSNSAPYVAYTDYSHSNKITVKKLANNVWTTVGTPSFSSFDAHYVDIAINKYNEPYVSFVDHVFPVAKKYINGDWKGLGNYIATTSCAYTAIVNDSLGNPYVLMALQSSATIPFVAKYSPCSDTSYHFTATAKIDAAIAAAGDSTTVTVTATGGQSPYTGTGSYRVAAGYYTYTIKDRNGCTASVSINVPDPCYWTGSVSSDWEDPNNWSCGMVPDGGTVVYIEANTPFYPIVSGIEMCKTLHVQKNAKIVIGPTAFITITGKDQ